VEKEKRSHENVPYFHFLKGKFIKNMERDGGEGDGKVQDIDGNLKDERAEQLIPEDCP
jgi:hypothetical protein